MTLGFKSSEAKQTLQRPIKKKKKEIKKYVYPFLFLI